MVTKTITVTKEAYEALASDKQKDESFSEVILRTHKKRGSFEAVSKFVGAWDKISDKGAESLKKDIYKMREQSTKRLLKRIEGI